MAPKTSELQPTIPFCSRRRNCGNFIMSLRLIAVFVSIATFAILIRYCVAQYKHGSMSGGVLGTLSAVFAWFIDWEQLGQLLALGLSVSSAVVIARFDQKAADKVNEYGGPTDIDRRGATALLATISGFRVCFFIFGGFVETSRFIARRRRVRRDIEAQRRMDEVTADTSVDSVMPPTPVVASTANTPRVMEMGIGEASGPDSGTVAPGRKPHTPSMTAHEAHF